MAKLGKVIAGLGAVAGGYMQGAELYRRREREEREDAERQEDRARRRAEEDRIAGDRITLANAAKPAEVQPLITNDDDGNPTSAPAVRLAAGGKYQSFADPGAAQTAATEYNKTSPYERQAQVLREQAKPVEALTLETKALEQTGLRQKMADEAWDRKVRNASTGPNWDSQLADLMTQTEAGPLKGRQVKATRSADGKVTFNTVEADGTLKPRFTFDDNDEGRARAAYGLLTSVSPKDRLEMIRQERKDQREAGKEAREDRESTAKVGYWNAYSNLLGAKASGVEAGGAGKPFKMDEDDRLAFTDANTRVRSAEENLTKAMTGLAGGNPDADPGVKFAREQLKKAQRYQLQVSARVGQYTPQQAANDLLASATNTKEVMVSLTELATTLGPEFSDKVGALVQGSDVWKQMNRGKAAPKTSTGSAAARLEARERATKTPAGTTVLSGGEYVPAGAASAPQPITLSGARLPEPGRRGGPDYSRVYGAVPEGTPTLEVPRLSFEEQERIYNPYGAGR